MNENIGFGVEMKVTNSGTETRLYGQGINNLKKEIIKEIDEQIIKPENEKIKQELEELKSSIQNKNESETKKILKKILDKGENLLLELIAKILVNYIKN